MHRSRDQIRAARRPAPPPVAVAALVLAAALGYGCGPADETTRLTPDERQHITEIVLAVAENPDEGVPQAHDQLWAILNRIGRPSERMRSQLQARFGVIAEGHRLFWQDARAAVRAGKPEKSAARTHWEDEMATAGWLSPQQRLRFEALMHQITDERPLPANHDVEVALSPEMVDTIAASWDAQEFFTTVQALLAP